MARIFLDTNFYFELQREASSAYIDATKRAKEKWRFLKENLLFISPLSTHILFYARKLKVPDQDVNELQEEFGIVSFTEDILEKALQGPTADLEDNIQLHSAAEAEADIFLTEDKGLLNIKFFGKTKIASKLEN